MIRRNRYEVTFSEKQNYDQISTDSTQNSPRSPSKASFLNKEKLELCRNYIQNGDCPYKSRCKFAHGSHELRKNNQKNSLYKTKQCVTFFKTGCCHYGDRCNFLHRKNNLEKTQKIRLIKTNFGDMFDSMREKSRLSSIFQ